MFFDFWRRAAHRRQKLKKMLNENLACFPIFGGVLRTSRQTSAHLLMNNLANGIIFGPFAVKTNLAQNPTFCWGNLLRILINRFPVKINRIS